MEIPNEINVLKEIDVLYNDLALNESRKRILETKIDKFLKKNVYVIKDVFVQNKIFNYFLEIYSLEDKIEELKQKIEKIKGKTL